MSVLPGRLDPIVTGPLAGGLLAASRPLPASYDQWRQGISFNSSCNGPAGLAGCINPDDAVDKTITPIGDPAVFEPFMAYSGRSCSTWMESGDILDLAQQGLDATLSSAFALQLQNGTIGVSPSLNSTATDITPTTPTDVTNTLSGLISAICSCGISNVMIHVNLRAIPFLVERRLVNWDASAGIWRYGPYPVSADCYGVVGPEDTGGNSEPDDGSAVWMYVSGMVETAISDELSLEGLDVAVNGKSELVERLGILRFDPCCVYAALAELF